MRRFHLIDNLKLRLGYGLAGNQGGIDSYTTMALVRPNGVTPVGNSPLVTYESLKNVNPDLNGKSSRLSMRGWTWDFTGTACCCR